MVGKMYRTIHPAKSHVTISTRSFGVEVTDHHAPKRRRKIRSCYNCRKRKLHCDQVSPACGRCVKAGQAADCLYLDDTPSLQRHESDTVIVRSNRAASPSQPSKGQSENGSQGLSGPYDDLSSKLRMQDMRIAELEASLEQMRNFLAQTAQSQNASSSGQASSRADQAPAAVRLAETEAPRYGLRETMLLKGKAFKTRFFGPTYAESMVAHISKIGILSKEILKKHPILVKLRLDLQAFDTKPQPSFTPGIDLSNLLPTRAESDELVRLYLDKYDVVYHIIHLPSFQAEYEQIWQTGISSARPHFIALVLLMTAAARCLRFHEPWLYAANSSAERENALAIATLCEDWVEMQSQKKLTITDFQVRFLINFVRIVNGSRFKRTWAATGKLLRTCMAAGLHIDMGTSATSSLTSTLDQEMRRRIWFAVAELELQSALARGMVSSPWPLQSDCAPPLNAHDEDIGDDPKPDSKPYSDFTRSSYLSIASQTIQLRHALNTALNDARHTISFEDAKYYTERIQSYLRDIPSWGTEMSKIPQAILSVTLREYLLILHSYQVRNSTAQSEQDFSKMVIVDNAYQIIQIHKALPKDDCFAVNFLCPVDLRASLALCYIVTAADSQASGAIAHYVDQFAQFVATEAVQLISDKVYRLGNGQQRLWIALVADALLKMEKDPERKAVYMQEAADGMSRPYYKIMAYQQTVSQAKSQASSSNKAVSVSGHSSEQTPSNMPSHADESWPDPLASHTPAMWNFEDWPFDEWTFDHLEMT